MARLASEEIVALFAHSAIGHSRRLRARIRQAIRAGSRDESDRRKSAGSCFASGVDVLESHAPPEPLDEDVGQRPPAAVHAHRHPGGVQPFRERLGRELPPWCVLNTAGRLLVTGVCLGAGLVGLIVKLVRRSKD
jgi:hypothetical protein